MAGPIDATSPSGSIAAITGVNYSGGIAIVGKSDFVGVWGESTKSAGVVGKAVEWRGVEGTSVNSVGVFGGSQNFAGVWGESPKSAGVVGKSSTWRGVDGASVSNIGVFGSSQNFVGVWAETQSPSQAAIFAKGPRLAARFEGNVEVTGDIQLVNADCAEAFDIMHGEMADADPGSVMVLTENGALRLCDEVYDRRVAGVISGAGAYRPAIVMDSLGDQTFRRPIALVGKVYCKVDADYAPIEAGDLLTTSSTSGHAMKATDTSRALGAIMGKALAPARAGRTLIPILVCLQ